jgi:predicted glycosyltransferase
MSVARIDMVDSPHKLATQWNAAATCAAIRKSFGAVILIVTKMIADNRPHNLPSCSSILNIRLNA